MWSSLNGQAAEQAMESGASAGRPGFQDAVSGPKFSRLLGSLFQLPTTPILTYFLSGIKYWGYKLLRRQWVTIAREIRNLDVKSLKWWRVTDHVTKLINHDQIHFIFKNNFPICAKKYKFTTQGGSQFLCLGAWRCVEWFVKQYFEILELIIKVHHWQQKETEREFVMQLSLLKLSSETWNTILTFLQDVYNM